jgi:hypothetical protein
MVHPFWPPASGRFFEFFLQTLSGLFIIFLSVLQKTAHTLPCGKAERTMHRNTTCSPFYGQEWLQRLMGVTF